MHHHYPKFMTVLSVVLLFFLLGYPGGLISSNDTYVYENSNPVAEKKSAQERPINNLRDFNNALVEIASATTPAVVTVRTEQTVRMQSRTPQDFFREFFGDPRGNGGNEGQQREYRQQGMGSGVIVSEDGYILTNNHVVASADTIYVGLENGDELTAEIVGTDPDSDIAVLRVDAQNLPFMTFGNSDELKTGEMVLAVGSPLNPGLAHSVSQGIVSSTGRSLGLMTFENFIQTDAAINRGNSGGPLVNMDGNIIGINTAIASQSGGFQGIGFAIPSNIASSIMESIIEHGSVIRGFIGISFEPVSENIARAFGLERTRGILVNDIVPDSPAEEAGMQSGDVIIEVNGETIREPREFQFEIANMKPGDEVSLTIIRNGEEESVDITLTQRPQDDEMAADDGGSVEDITGFAVRNLSDEITEQLRIPPNVEGVVVESIDQNSQAYRNNLRQGDVIIAVNQNPVISVSEFNSIVSAGASRDVILLQVIRQNQRFFVAFEPRT